MRGDVTDESRVEATFCFVDVSGFTALTEAHGDSAAADLIQRFGELVQEALDDRGQLVDAVGDAVLVMHPTPAQAADFVARLFRRAASEPDFPALRAGLHHGPVVERDGRFYGATLNLAARVASQAHGGQVLGTGTVAEAVRARGIEASRLGPHALRNVRDPVDLFALEFEGAHTTSAVDPVCRMRVEPDRAPGRLRHEGVDYWFCSLACVAQFAASPETFTPSSGPA